MKVVLVGYRGTGKSAVARALGNKLGWPVVSTDALVEQRVGCSIARFVEVNGWPAFRAVESQTVADLADRDAIVIDTGGGAILEPANRAALRARGRVVWLQADPTTIAKRISGDAGRPALRPGESLASEIVSVLAEREALYRASSDHHICTDVESADEVAERIRALIADDLT